ncbi:centrosome and spindle pole-associated protein 1 isoform X2 [Anarhichas minor]|uniref:centrosome and spindle pole-associated protein 1 isoform X2 n=1 Tax=Anarhichas minor TaxID=65739 RepID=UPI003F733031
MQINQQGVDMPPASAAHRTSPNPDRGLCLSLLLGNDYEKKKKKLQQELQLDYKHHAAKIKDLKTGERPTQPQGLSLPIDEKISVQEKLREERKKEYHLFLQEKDQIERFKRGTPPVTLKPGQVQASDAVYSSSPASPLPILNIHRNTHPPPRERPASTRDAASLTEAEDNGKSTGTWGPGHRRRRRWQLRGPKEPYSPEEEPITDKEEELEFRHRGRQERHTPEPEYKEERRTRERRANRAPQSIKKMEAPGVRDQNNNERGWESKNTHPPPRERPASRRDAASLTEAEDNGKSTGTWGPGHRRRRRWQLRGPKEPYSSEEEPITDKEEELEFRHRGRQDRHTPEPEYKEERRTRERRANRAPQSIKKMEAPGVRDQNNNERGWKSDLPDSMRTAARSRPATSKDIAEFATGLMIGAVEDQTASQMRKEQYKQELLKQIAEKQRNKLREKELELRVATTGATDPEKQPDRFKQFGSMNRRRGVSQEDTEQRAPPGKSHVDHSTALSQLAEKTAPGSGTRAAQGVPSLDYFDEDYHRNFSNMLGEVANPRVAGVPPLVPPAVTNNYKTPYDAAYYYYGTRNPFDLNLPYNPNGLPGGMHQSGNHSPPQRPPTFRPNGHTERGPSRQNNCVAAPSLSAPRATEQHSASPLDVGELSADRSKQRRAKALSHQEALRQQIIEREERKRREKEEKERFDAKIEAEMMAYNPWGRSGGGASIKDEKGNLVSDLKQMHRNNEESCRNPVSRKSGQTQSFLMTDGNTPVDEGRAALSHRRSGFKDKPSPQQLHMQDRYKEDLKQQIEENKQKQTEEKERMRIEEEKEEKRLADQRARIQQDHEEELRKQKMINHKLKKADWIQEPKTQHRQEEKRQEEETEKKVPGSARDREEKKAQLSYEQREPSPPIPTLQRKQTHPVASRPSSVESQLTDRTERSVSAADYRPVPEKISPLQDGQQEVIRELSALRKYLRNEQRQLEVQLGQTDLQESPDTPSNRPRGRPRGTFDQSMHKQAVQPSTRSPFSGAAGVNMQHIREFNQLKYRDTASREEVRHMFPGPPTDEQSLDIQQQALLREQRRKIRLMKREEEHDVLEQQLSHCRSRNKPGRYTQRDSILPSEAAFIGVYSGDAHEGQVHQQRHRRPSAERHERTTSRRRRDYDDGAVSIDQGERNNQPDAHQSLQSVTSLHLESKFSAHNQHRIRRQNTGDHDGRSEAPSGDEVDVLSLRSALERRVSMDTVATEAWLRPGTSDTVERAGCLERPNGGMDAPPWLIHRVS